MDAVAAAEIRPSAEGENKAEATERSAHVDDESSVVVAVVAAEKEHFVKD
jgi:hypothetical protein